MLCLLTEKILTAEYAEIAQRTRRKSYVSFALLIFSAFSLRTLRSKALAADLAYWKAFTAEYAEIPQRTRRKS